VHEFPACPSSDDENLKLAFILKSIEAMSTTSGGTRVGKGSPKIAEEHDLAIARDLSKTLRNAGQKVPLFLEHAIYADLRSDS